jgi:hypothetical protein
MKKAHSECVVRMKRAHSECVVRMKREKASKLARLRDFCVVQEWPIVAE